MNSRFVKGSFPPSSALQSATASRKSNRVDIPSLDFAWRSVTMTGPLTGAKLVIERPEGTAFCTDCGETVPLAKFGDACPKCGGFRLIPNGGTELKVLDFVPADDEAEESEPETN